MHEYQFYVFSFVMVKVSEIKGKLQIINMRRCYKIEQHKDDFLLLATNLTEPC